LTTEHSKDSAEFYPKLNTNTRPTIHRGTKLDFKPPELDSKEIVIAVDSTGIKVHNRGEWMRGEMQEEEGLDKDSLCRRC